MKKILYTLLAGAMALSSCNKEAATELAPGNETTTFTLSVDEPGTRATTITPARYVMEVYSEDGTTAENVFEDGTKNQAQITSGNSFTVALDKTKAYTCLFWADDNGTTYDAASLKAITIKDGKEVNEAYHANVAVAKGKNPAVSVTLKRAVAKVTLSEAAEVETSKDIALKFSNIYPSFSVLDGGATGTATTWSKTIKPSATTGDFATFYFLAKPTQELTEFEFTYATEPEKTVSNVPYQQNYATSIKGAYSSYGSFTFTVTADDEWNTPDNEVDLGEPVSMSLTIDTRKNTDDASDKTFILPLNATLSGYSLTVDWGDSNIEKFVNGTELNQANMTHTYAAAGVYTITISSSQKDYSKAQMPSIRFLNYKDVNKNSIKLISIDTPLLNMGTDLSNCFIGCTSLTSIPATLFEKNIATTDFSRCFYGCTGLTSIPATLFEKNIATTDFSRCFYGCTGLISIPATLFEKNTAATNFTLCFNGCKALTSIPATLFEKNTAATTFSSCFYGCKALTEIPATLFEKNTAATSFWGCFYGCNALTSIPATLFEKNTAVTDFGYCFLQCTSLTSIPATLFEKNTVATDFRQCFYGCNALTSIPVTLFEKNTAATNFSYCFSSCEALTSIPATLFQNNTLVTDFSSCFASCTALTSMPAGLFAKNTLATAFKGCFSYCSELTLNANIFCKETDEKTTRFAGKTMNFDSCFYGCSSNSSIGAGAGGTAPALWSYTMEAGSTKAECFKYVTKVTNVADIPAEWK